MTKKIFFLFSFILSSQLIFCMEEEDTASPCIDSSESTPDLFTIFKTGSAFKEIDNKLVAFKTDEIKLDEKLLYKPVTTDNVCFGWIRKHNRDSGSVSGHATLDPIIKSNEQAYVHYVTSLTLRSLTKEETLNIKEAWLNKKAKFVASNNSEEVEKMFENTLLD